MAPRAALQIASRTVVAMTCRHCGKLKPGSEFPRYRRSHKDRMLYKSRRCGSCWWSHMDRSLGKSKNLTGYNRQHDYAQPVPTS